MHLHPANIQEWEGLATVHIIASVRGPAGGNNLVQAVAWKKQVLTSQDLLTEEQNSALPKFTDDQWLDTMNVFSKIITPAAPPFGNSQEIGSRQSS